MHMGSRKRVGGRGVTVVLVLCAVVGGAYGVATAADPGPTKGRIPSEAATDQGVDLAKVPDYVEALDRSGKAVGFVDRRYLFAEETGASEAYRVERIPVVADDLVTVVGHMVAGRGFVPLGEPDRSVEPFEGETTEFK